MDDCKTDSPLTRLCARRTISLYACKNTMYVGETILAKGYEKIDEIELFRGHGAAIPLEQRRVLLNQFTGDTTGTA
jgi:hypothetical protein